MTPVKAPFQFIVSAALSGKDPSSHMGTPEYSYKFVLDGFKPLLNRLGNVIEAIDPSADVDKIYDACVRAGQPCLFLHFTAPHNYIHTIRCPTMLVFAWEYDTLPTEHWAGDGAQDWRAALSATGAAIVHSESTVRAVKKAMGNEYPVIFIPNPTYDECEELREKNRDAGPVKEMSIQFYGMLIDSRDISLTPHLTTEEEIEELLLCEDRTGCFLYERGLELDAREENIKKCEEILRKKMSSLRAHECEHYEQIIENQQSIRHALGVLRRRLLGLPIPKPELPEPSRLIDDIFGPTGSTSDTTNKGPSAIKSAPEEPAPLEPSVHSSFYAKGVNYFTVLTPYDKRKNWRDMVTAYCMALKDAQDATLVIKVSAEFVTRFTNELIEHLRRLDRFFCRIAIIKAHLPDDAFDRLFLGGAYYVNTSFGEGQCLPLMRAMAAGIPAITPKITAMADYVDSANCFIPGTHIEPIYWQHDPRKCYRTRQYRVDWPDLARAFRESYKIAKSSPETYKSMSRAATEAAARHNSLDVLQERFETFLKNEINLQGKIHSASDSVNQ
jgi:glycosyltransferase involved in cell wall biosynthesis